VAADSKAPHVLFYYCFLLVFSMNMTSLVCTSSQVSQTRRWKSQFSLHRMERLTLKTELVDKRRGTISSSKMRHSFIMCARDANDTSCHTFAHRARFPWLEFTVIWSSWKTSVTRVSLSLCVTATSDTGSRRGNARTLRWLPEGGFSFTTFLNRNRRCAASLSNSVVRLCLTQRFNRVV